MVEGCFLCTVTTVAPSFLRSEVKPPYSPSFPPFALFWLAAESTEWQPGWDGAMEPCLLLRSSGVIKDHTPAEEFILTLCVAVVPATHFHFLQPLVGDLKVLWHNTEGQKAHVEHPDPMGLSGKKIIWKQMTAQFLGSVNEKQFVSIDFRWWLADQGGVKLWKTSGSESRGLDYS